VYAGPRAAGHRRRHGAGHAAGEGGQQDRPSPPSSTSTRTARSATCSLRCAGPSRTPTSASPTRSARRTSELDGMGTTLTALRFTGRAGRAGARRRLTGLLAAAASSSPRSTHDDTYVQSLVDSGKLTARGGQPPSPQVGDSWRPPLMGADVDPDVSIREARAGDRYLLCTDGLVRPSVTAPTPARGAERGRSAGVRRPGSSNWRCVAAVRTTSRASWPTSSTRASATTFPVIGGRVRRPDRTHAAALRRRQPGRAGGAHDPPPTCRSISMRCPGGRRWLRRLVITVGVLVVLIGGTGRLLRGGRRASTSSESPGDEVAIFRGVNTEFGPLKFYKLSKNTSLKIDDLTQAAPQPGSSPAITAHSPSGRAGHRQETC